MTSCSSRGS